MNKQIETTMATKATYKRLGDYIRLVDVRNRDLKVEKLMGINIDKFFMPSVANVIGTDLSNYKIVSPNQFACNLMHVGRDEKIPMAMLSKHSSQIIVSPAYLVFEVNNEDNLMPQYLMMWFRRTEFDRNAWFYTDADVRGGLDKDSLLDMTLPIPPIEEQRKTVAEYQTLVKRIEINNQLIAKLEDTAQAIYRNMFVDGIDKENLPEGWKMGTLGDLGKIIGGATPSTDVPQNWCENGISWLSPADLSKQKRKFISKGAKDITEIGFKSCSTKILPIRSVLFSSRAPIGLMAITTKELCTNQGFKSIIPNLEFSCEYIYYYLLSKKDEISMENEGSTFNEISGQEMKDYSAIVPAISEMKKFSQLTKPLLFQQKILEDETNKIYELQSLLLAKMGQ